MCKTSFVVDFDKAGPAKDKVEPGKEVLGTRALTGTVAAAHDDVIELQQRRRLVEMLFTPGRLQLDDPDAMAGAWR
jgi:hypothetical protein